MVENIARCGSNSHTCFSKNKGHTQSKAARHNQIAVQEWLQRESPFIEDLTHPLISDMIYRPNFNGLFAIFYCGGDMNMGIKHLLPDSTTVTHIDAKKCTETSLKDYLFEKMDLSSIMYYAY